MAIISIAGHAEPLLAGDPSKRRDLSGGLPRGPSSTKEMGGETIWMGDIYQLFLHFYLVKG